MYHYICTTLSRVLKTRKKVPLVNRAISLVEGKLTCKKINKSLHIETRHRV